jgi:pimeloyl-ACP methyl ester carboxylesterase
MLAGNDQGHPNDPPVVLLHGAASTHRWWDPVAAHLATHHRVLRYDHRGHGQSSTPTGGYTVDGLATDTIQVLDGLGLTRAVLAGHSAGADIALTVAATRPDLVAALACIDGGVYDPTLLHGPTWPQARSRMLHDRRSHPTAPVLREWLHAHDLPAEALPCLLANYRTTSDGRLQLRLHPTHEEQLAHSLWTQDPMRLLQAVRIPVLVIAALGAGNDRNRPRGTSIRRARDILADCLVVQWLPGGHHLPLQRPVPVSEALADLAVSTTLTGSPA